MNELNFNRILVPLDFSTFSDTALESAVRLASEYEASLTLAHVLHPLQQHHQSEESCLIDYKKFVNSRGQWAEQQLSLRQQRLAARNLDVDTVMLRSESPADCLTDFAHEEFFDLIVLGTHGQTGLKHFVRGSVASQVVVNSPVPVLTVHRSVISTGIRNVLAPVDFSTHSANSADYAVSIASRCNAKITFLHVIEQEIDRPFYTDDVDFILGFDSDLTDLVADNLHEFVEDIIDSSLETEFVIRRGVAHKEICEYVKEHPIDLMVISSHGQGGLEYLLMGRTSEEVTRWANCPVLTIRPHNF